MAENPANLTLPAGISLWLEDFDATSTTYVDAGRITPPSLGGSNETLDHFTARSGSRSRDKVVIIEKSFTLNFNFEEVKQEHIKRFFFGTTGATVPTSLADGTSFSTGSTAVAYNVLLDPLIQVKAKLLMKPDVGKGFQYDIPKAQLQANGEMSLDEQDWLNMPMTLRVLDDSANNTSSPFGVITHFDPSSDLN